VTPVFSKGDLLLAATAAFCTRLDTITASELDESEAEPVKVTWEGLYRESSHPNVVRLVLGYLAKISPNYGARAEGALWAMWSELVDHAGGSYEQVGPDFLAVSDDLPAPVTKSYRAELREKKGRGYVVSPYQGRGGEAYYATMSAFAIIRSARSVMGKRGSRLDAALSELCDSLQRGEFDPARMRGLRVSSEIADGIARAVAEEP
jgi:hypothetical protein